MKRHGCAKVVTGAAVKALNIADRQEVGRWANNRVENSHQPFRRRERAMLRFRRMKTLGTVKANALCGRFRLVMSFRHINGMAGGRVSPWFS